MSAARTVWQAACALALLEGCGDRSGLVNPLPPSGSDGGGAQTADAADATAAQTVDVADATAAQTVDVADATAADVEPDTRFADAPLDVLGACSTPDGGWCPFEHILWLPLSGDPAACGLTSLGVPTVSTGSVCVTLCHTDSLIGCALEQDGGVNLIACYCPSTLVP